MRRATPPRWRCAGGGTKGGIVEYCQILIDRPARDIGREPLLTRVEALAVGLCPDKARIHRETVTANQALSNAALHSRVEQPAQQIAVAKAAVAVLGEGRVVGHAAGPVRAGRTSERRG